MTAPWAFSLFSGLSASHFHSTSSVPPSRSCYPSHSLLFRLYQEVTCKFGDSCVSRATLVSSGHKDFLTFTSLLVLIRFTLSDAKTPNLPFNFLKSRSPFLWGL